MAVPNTNTFSLQDVIDNIVEGPNNLVSCFNGAASKGFVAAYAGSKDRLSNFRGYSQPSSGGY
jgi:hypothetical protein